MAILICFFPFSARRSRTSSVETNKSKRKNLFSGYYGLHAIKNYNVMGSMGLIFQFFCSRTTATMKKLTNFNSDHVYLLYTCRAGPVQFSADVNNFDDL